MYILNYSIVVFFIHKSKTKGDSAKKSLVLMVNLRLTSDIIHIRKCYCWSGLLWPTRCIRTVDVKI